MATGEQSTTVSDLDANWLIMVGENCPAQDRSTATAAILLHHIETRKHDTVLGEYWSENLSLYRASAAQIRAAIAHGFAYLNAYGVIELPAAPDTDDLRSVSRQSVESALTNIASQLLGPAIETISKADYGDCAAQHKRALEDLLSRNFEDVLLTDRWYPMEVIELTSHVPTSLGGIPCTAIVLLDAIRTNDNYGSASFRLERHAEFFCGLAEPQYSAFWAAFRFLYENDPFWADSMPSRKFDPAALMPWVSDEFAI
ncbi:hypothetical protein [Yoonia sp. I 8.24]|uniref:hypothetical protein n=1 Tax=Yoonia sp. I 8.24 TaxID=1537229 RepID=UPI001EE033C6|nr:hypothetical protein [Yoonia sp. I 8.24]MCG3267820.1 hypothetical protein [Yoonia sp. I 8.24]